VLHDGGPPSPLRVQANHVLVVAAVQAFHGGMRVAQLGVVGVVAATVLVLSAQPAQSAPALHVSLTQATYGQLAPSTVEIAAGRPAQQVTTRFHIDQWSSGPTSVLVLIGRPGSTDDVEQNADLAQNAALRPENQLVAENVTTDAVTTRFSAPAAGRYPVFLLLSGPEDACGSANMVEPPIHHSVTQLGVIDIRG
jgi:hypothetical protein